MTNLPDDPIDAREARFARRVREFTEPAVVPVDHASVAATAARTGGPRPQRGGSRVGWLFAGAAAVAAVALLVNGFRGPDVGASPSLPSTAAATVAPSAAVAACQVSELQGRIISWEGAAGSRIASVTLRSTAAATCRVMDYQLALVDGGGRGMGLIVGSDVLPGFTIEPGQVASTLVQVSNYCLAATPREPVSLRMDGTEEDLVFTPAEDGSSGVPPCNGAGVPASISQQPWQVAAG
jgi:hypothetical protein